VEVEALCIPGRSLGVDLPRRTEVPVRAADDAERESALTEPHLPGREHKALVRSK
jgi:hypothetical protein